MSDHTIGSLEGFACFQRDEDLEDRGGLEMPIGEYPWRALEITWGNPLQEEVDRLRVKLEHLKDEFDDRSVLAGDLASDCRNYKEEVDRLRQENRRLKERLAIIDAEPCSASNTEFHCALASEAVKRYREMHED
jgi:hypothetical protein